MTNSLSSEQNKIMINLYNSTVMVVSGAGFEGSAIAIELLTHNCKVITFENYLDGVPESVNNPACITVVKEMY